MFVCSYCILGALWLFACGVKKVVCKEHNRHKN